MSSKNEIVLMDSIHSHIFTFRGVQIMIDRDLAQLFEVETKRLNEQVRRNIDRFPAEFMFKLTADEMANWKSQIATSNKITMGIRKQPLAFTV